MSAVSIVVAVGVILLAVLVIAPFLSTNGDDAVVAPSNPAAPVTPAPTQPAPTGDANPATPPAGNSAPPP
jgi:hypothetical protein